MGTATTGNPWGLRYPDGAVGAKPNVASDIKNLATDTATKLSTVNTAAGTASTAAANAQATADSATSTANGIASTRPKAAAGYVSLNPSHAANGGYDDTATVTFPAGRFAGAPMIATGIASMAASNQHAGVGNPTATGFTIYYWRETSVPTGVNWIAMVGGV